MSPGRSPISCSDGCRPLLHDCGAWWYLRPSRSIDCADRRVVRDVCDSAASSNALVSDALALGISPQFRGSATIGPLGHSVVLSPWRYSRTAFACRRPDRRQSRWPRVLSGHQSGTGVGGGARESAGSADRRAFVGRGRATDHEMEHEHRYSNSSRARKPMRGRMAGLP